MNKTMECMPQERKRHSHETLKPESERLPAVSVAIPAYNEERSIAYVVGSLRKHLGRRCVIVVVDDGSTDRTAEIAAKSGADLVVRHIRNRGVAMAYRSAIQTALRLHPDVICTIDADGQYDPADVRNLVKPILDGKADVVLGSRFCNNSGYNGVPILNYLSNKLMGILVSLLAGRRVHDVESGFRAISARAAEKLDLLGWVSFSHDMILDTSWKQFRILEVPVKVRYFRDRKSKAIDSMASYGLRAVLAVVVKMVSFCLNPAIARRDLPRSVLMHVSNRLQDAANDLHVVAEKLNLFAVPRF